MEKRNFPFFFLLLIALFATHFYLEHRERRRIEEWKRHYENEKPKELTPALVDSVKGAEKKVREDEDFYVIETPWQQLVFSNYGGALSEINLPFRSQSHKESVVLATNVDREMVEDQPSNSIFPLLPYKIPNLASENKKEEQKEEKTSVNEKKISQEALKKGSFGGYYPLLRRTLVEKNKSLKKIDPRYYSLNIVSESEDFSDLRFQVTHYDDHSITFEAVQGKRRIIKTYSVSRDTSVPYCFDLSLEIAGDTKGLWLSSGVPEVEWISAGPAPSLKYRITKGKNRQVDPIDLPEKSSTFSLVRPDWISNSNGFFSIILDPLTKLGSGFKVIKVSGETVPSRLPLLDPESFKQSDLPGYETMIPLEEGISKFRIFAGPLSSSILNKVDAIFTNSKTGYDPDYRSSQTYHGWFTWISEPFAKILFFIMQGFHFVTGSWGLSIILLTIFVRFLLYPLKLWSTHSMMKMQEISPQIQAIQTKYKSDPTKIKDETLKLYQEKGANPVLGCLPVFIQLPFLIWMYDLLKSTFELRGACFIPGWITDLAAPDVFYELPFRLPFFGNEIHFLPIIMGFLMFLTQRILPTASPVDPNSEQARSQKTMGTFMSVLFTIFFYNMPSGLNIYFITSTLCDSLQQWWIVKNMKKK